MADAGRAVRSSATSGRACRRRESAGACARGRGRRPITDKGGGGWTRRSTSRISRSVRTWAGQTADYGYGWWVLTHSTGDVWTAAGALGQWIFVVPSLGLVVVATSNNDQGPWTAPVEFLYSHILPAAS